MRLHSSIYTLLSPCCLSAVSQRQPGSTYKLLFAGQRSCELICVPRRTFLPILLNASVFALWGGEHTAAHCCVPASKCFMICLQDEPPQQKQDGLSSLMQLASGAHYQMTSAGPPQGAMQPSQERSSGSVGGAPPGMYQRAPAGALLPQRCGLLCV